MNRAIARALTSLVILLSLSAAPSKADTELEGRFQDVFVTAGYSAAAGAAIGAALLTFQDEPTRHLKFVSVGASLGFLSGTLAGSWLAIAPAFVDNTAPMPTQLAQNTKPRTLVIRPWFDSTKNTVTSLEAGAVLAKF
jgi:hypothetical protein